MILFPMTTEFKRTMVSLCIRLPPDIVETIKALSYYHGMSNSCYIRNIVLNALRNEGQLNRIDNGIKKEPLNKFEQNGGL